ncbi:Secreted protein with PEP-CTERM sorting signal [Prescottella defluvii]
MEIFWLILMIGALVMLIPVARQAFRRNDDD